MPSTVPAPAVMTDPRPSTGTGGMWATGVSHLPHAAGQPNLLHLTSPALGVAAAALSILLSVTLLAAALSFWADARRASTRRPA